MIVLTNAVTSAPVAIAHDCIFKIETHGAGDYASSRVFHGVTSTAIGSIDVRESVREIVEMITAHSRGE